MKEALTREVLVRNELGLHARAASQLVRLTGTFSSDIFLEKGGLRVNGKSIMGILMLEAPKGSLLRLEARGEDAGAALEALVHLIEVEKFNEQ